MRLLSGGRIGVLSIYNADLHGECEEKRIVSNLELRGEVETRMLEMFPRTILTVSAKARRGFSVQDRAFQILVHARKRVRLYFTVG
jgi:hypothetical protein